MSFVGYVLWFMHFLDMFFTILEKKKIYTVELEWLEYLWDTRNLFELLVFRATEG